MPEELITPEVIAAECLLIQSLWSPTERIKRMRVDLRPVYRRADGVIEEVDSEAYWTHLRNDGSNVDDETES